MKNLTPEMIEKAKVAKTADELLEIAKANGVEMTPDEAATYFAQLNPTSGELDDDDLDNVAGGACQGEGANSSKARLTVGACQKCGSIDVEIIFAYDIDHDECSKCGHDIVHVECSKCGHDDFGTIGVRWEYID